MMMMMMRVNGQDYLCSSKISLAADLYKNCINSLTTPFPPKAALQLLFGNSALNLLVVFMT